MRTKEGTSCVGSSSKISVTRPCVMCAITSKGPGARSRKAPSGSGRAGKTSNTPPAVDNNISDAKAAPPAFSWGHERQQDKRQGAKPVLPQPSTMPLLNMRHLGSDLNMQEALTHRPKGVLVR